MTIQYMYSNIRVDDISVTNVFTIILWLEVSKCIAFKHPHQSAYFHSPLLEPWIHVYYVVSVNAFLLSRSMLSSIFLISKFILLICFFVYFAQCNKYYIFVVSYFHRCKNNSTLYSSFNNLQLIVKEPVWRLQLF